MARVRQWHSVPTETPKWLIEQRIRSGKPPYPHLDFSQPCKNGQPFVRADGSCLRCGADQGVAGPKEACHPKE